MDIQGAGAIVVGGASGMARATARDLAQHGAKVVIFDLPKSKGAEVAEEIGGGTQFFPLDIMDEAAVESTIEKAVQALGGLHIGVNVAGWGWAQRTITRDGPHPLDPFRKVMEINVVATFNLIRLQAHHMSKNTPNADGERGVILCTSSIAAYEGQIGQAAYSASKAAVAGMMLPIARDLGSLGIRCNAIAPSLFDTGLIAPLPDQMKSALIEDAAFPRRMGKPEEYARLARAIIENPMLNGGTIRLDAGQRFRPK
ncbi:MAG: SDR family oxidoreductase [Deltaproteobacteria bacterium]|nr:SDR family oxidoreductase [Deltaproteobacteria bacterium]